MRINKPWWNAAFEVIGFETPIEPPAQTPEVLPVTPPVTPPAGDGTDGDDVEPARDPAALKSALQKERADRKALEKQVKAFEKAQQEKADSEKSEIQRLTDADQAKATKLQKLADGYRTSKVEAAILTAAKKAEFLDPSDALRPEVIAAIGVEQDDDDPTQVTIDSATVTTAIKELAKNKPHWLVSKKPPPSGSKFGGASTGGGTQTEEQKLIARYPALGRR